MESINNFLSRFSGGFFLAFLAFLAFYFWRFSGLFFSVTFLAKKSNLEKSVGLYQNGLLHIHTCFF